jgi:glycerol-1-phosphate dehydrogenase [NAD(P)+]
MVKPNHAMHGERCGVGTIMMAYLHGANWKRIKEAIQKLGAPTNAHELGVDREDIITALELAAKIRPERFTILNKLSLDRKAYEHLAEVTGVV